MPTVETIAPLVDKCPHCEGSLSVHRITPAVLHGFPKPKKIQVQVMACCRRACRCHVHHNFIAICDAKMNFVTMSQLEGNVMFV